jgi:alkanesulfonate monooxygenase SsuD/methylene tetrahydromethanopterin reductase-like flavin-dependent oxidoreductase (luciferase family)
VASARRIDQAISRCLSHERAAPRGGPGRGEAGLKRSLLYQIGDPDGTQFEPLREQILLAEELGLHAIWCLPSLGDEGAFCESAPEVWLSALASCTRRIRLGWGVARMLPPEQPPMRVAEQGATLDLTCHGRLDIVCLPDGDLPRERDEPREGWEEGFRMLVHMWDRPAFSWSSARFDVTPVDVLPKPVQKPHPPIWLAGWTLDHAAAAGVAGLGFLDVSGTGDAGLEGHRKAYLDARASADVHDLVCESAFAAALDLPCDEEGVQRLAGWESMGIDQAVLRAGPLEGGHDEALRRIRLLASEDARVH